MNLVKITITDRRGVALVAPTAMGFDVNDITVPVRFNSAESKSFFSTRAIKDNDNVRRNIANIDYKSSDTLADIKALSGQLLLLTVNTRRGVAVSEEMVFVNSKISEALKTVSGGTSFYYMEEGDPLPVEYIVDEDIDTIIAQQPEGGPPGAIPTFVIEGTWEEIDALKTANNLEKGSFYKITDRYNYQAGGSGTIPNQTFLGDDRGLVYIQALETNVLSKEAIRIMACPSFYDSGIHGVDAWNGVWHPTIVLGINELAIYGGVVWSNNGLDPTGTNINNIQLDATNWTKKVKTLTNLYTDKQFSCLYDFDNDWFEEQKDGSGNEVGYDFAFAVDTGKPYNPCDVTDWNFTGGRGAGLSYFYNNKVRSGIYNNVSQEIHSNTMIDYESEIRDNKTIQIYSNTGREIVGNTCLYILRNRVNSIIINTNTSSIANNICYQIADNGSTIVSIDNNIIMGNINSNNNTGNISFNSTNEYFNSIIGLPSGTGHMTNNYLKNNASLVLFTINITGLTVYDLNTDLLNPYLKAVLLTSTNATETINTLTNSLRPISFHPENGLTVTFGIVGNLKLEGGVAAIINGTNEDWIEFDKSKTGTGANMINGANY